MKTITTLISTAIRSLDNQVVAKSLCGTASIIIEFCNKIKKHSLRTSLKSYGFVCSDRLNSWALPDAVWTAFCLKHPRLNYYPLGRITERAVKKIIVILSLKNATHKAVEANPGLNEHKIQNNLRRSIKILGIRGVLKLFLSQYFFELCIDQFRRSWRDLQFDSGYWYNFSKDGYFVSLSNERKLRQTLANQCKVKTGIFLPFLMECIEERDFTRNKQRISDAFVRTFGILLPKRENLKNLRKSFLNVIVGTKSLSELRKSYVVDKKAKRFLFHTEDPNISFSFDVLERLLGHNIHSLIKDLLDIGTTVYMADLYTKREFNLERRVSVLMPVRHPRVWSNAQKEIEKTVSFLGRDNFSIKFIKRKEETDKLRRFSVKSDNRCVCLFSGGLDSLAGAAWVLNHKLDPIFVSHYSSNILVGIQKSLISQLEKIYDRPIQHLSLRVSKTGDKKIKNSLSAPFRSVMIQHLRSFLFLSLATAVALESKIKKIYIFENGPVALNPLFSEARVNTRTTHPHFLVRFKELIKAVFGIDLIIENPFLYRTKGEVVNILARQELQGLVAKTVSCWNWSRVPLWAKQGGIKRFKGRHDGECIPCIIRRSAVYHARLWEKDANYLTNVFNQFFKLQRDKKTMIADFLRFCLNMRSLSDTELLFHAPDLSVCEEKVNPQKLVRMYKRHAKEITDCFRAKSNKKFQRIFAPAFK